MNEITVLVVDDIEMNRALVKKMFEESGFLILEAANGVEAMQVIADHTIDVVITDIFMEPMDGYELIHNIRNQAQYKKIPIIAVTESDQASRKRALQAGADDLVYRPFVSSILHNRVKGLLSDGMDLNLHRMANENNPVPFLLYHVIDRPDTPSYKIIYLNRAARESFSPPYLEDLVTTNESPAILEFLLSTLRSGEPQQKTFFESSLNKWLDWTAYQTGNAMVAALIKDITETVDAKTAESKHAADEAIEARDKLSDILSNIPSGVLVIKIEDEGETIVEVNAALCKFMGIEHDLAVGSKTEKILQFIHPDDHKIVLAAMKELSEPDKVVSYISRNYNKLKKEYVWSKAEAYSKKQPDGCIYAFISFDDITAEKELAETNKALVEEKAANAAKTMFLSRMSHDMRTPLNGILGLTALLKGMVTDRKVQRYLADMEVSGKYLLNLINDTLDVSRIESGKLELHPEVCSGKHLFNNVVKMIQPSMDAKGLKFEVKTENLPFTKLYIDCGRVEQIVMNVLSNAVKFTPSGGSVTMTMRNISVVDNLILDELIIKDTGIGMKDEFLKRIFEPFSQADSSTTTAHEGTGLGMSITRQLLELMGGNIRIESEPGKGTTVYIQLPLAIATEEQLNNQPKVYKLDAETNNLKGKRILICEDHPLNAKITGKLLEVKGVRAEFAENGLVGVNMFQNSPIGYYDAILMDIRMPIMDGIEAATHIRNMPRADARRIPIIAMTANAFDEDIRTTKAVGMNAHLSKPIDVDAFYYTLSELLSDRSNLKRYKAMIVDDIEINRAVIKVALEKDYEIFEAADGVEALAVLKKNPDMDILITDVQMPNMGGEELIKNIRKEDIWKHLIIIANTQFGDYTQEERLMDLGADDFVYKAATPKILEMRVRNAMRNI